MVIDLVRSVGSANVCFRINERTCVANFARAIESPRSRLNETSRGLGKIGAVSGSDCRILKFLMTTFLAAKLLGWKVSVKGIRSSLSEADGSKADSLLTFWTRLSALDKMLSG